MTRQPGNGEAALSPPEKISAGLTSTEARRRLAALGPNTVVEKAQARWRALVAKFWSPVAWMLEVAILLQLWLGQYVEAGVVAGLLLFNATLGTIQEGRASTALAALKKRLAPAAFVHRDGEWIRLPAAELVPHDVIRLPLGTIVPADATISWGSVMVDQSMLTGESLPVDANPGSPVYAGSLVRRGQAIAEVTATGSRTYFGRTAELVREARAVSTEQAAIFAATRNLAIVNGTIAALIIASAYIMALPSIDQVRLALTALLATIPLALPATFTLSAALSAQVLAARGVLLTRLSAAHEAAAMDVLCADKTGTLTRNTLEVVDVVAMAGFAPDRVLGFAALASSEADDDPIDAAVRGAAARSVGSYGPERLRRFFPFDPANRTSEAFALDPDGHELRVVKGAFEAVAKIAADAADAERLVDDLAGQGHRVIAVAAGAPKSLCLVGLIVLSDLPREDSASLVAKLRDMGVRTLMVTGDSPVTAAAIARKVGIASAVCPPERVSPAVNTDDFGVFARVAPAQKYQLVKTGNNQLTEL